MRVAAGAGLLPGQADLVDDFLRVPLQADFGVVVAWPEMARLYVLLGPPSQQHRIALLLGIDRPIKLRTQIIDPAFRQPLPRVGEEFIVSVQALDGRGVAWAPDAKRADAKFHERFLLLDSPRKSLH